MIASAAAVLFLMASPFQDLTAYEGEWHVKPPFEKGSREFDQLINRCVERDIYFTCEQVLNGKPISLVVFTTTDDPKKFHVQNVLPTGFATGRTDLSVDGSHWTYLGKDTEDSKTTWYRTDNYFTGRDRIHFEQYRSSDGQHWEKQSEGDEARAAETPAR